MRLIAIIPVLALSLIGLAACGGGKSNTAQNAASTMAQNAGTAAHNVGNAMTGNSMESANGQMAPNCGAVKPVWVNMNSKAYHEPGDPFYGKTKHGKYMCPSAAKAAGYHPAGSHAMTDQSQMGYGHHHHSNASNMSGNAPMDQATP